MPSVPMTILPASRIFASWPPLWASAPASPSASAPSWASALLSCWLPAPQRPARTVRFRCPVRRIPPACPPPVRQGQAVFPFSAICLFSSSPLSFLVPPRNLPISAHFLSLHWLWSIATVAYYSTSPEYVNSPQEADGKPTRQVDPYSHGMPEASGREQIPLLSLAFCPKLRYSKNRKLMVGQVGLLTDTKESEA